MPPPTIFIRALQTVPSEGLLEVDWFRNEPVLGWRRYDFDFVTKELTTEGDHFSIFTSKHVRTF